MNLLRLLELAGTRPRLSIQPERPAEVGPHDWLFVTAEQTRGWILDAICREIGSRQPGTWTVAYGAKIDLPQARTYFFSHYLLYLIHRQRNPHIMSGRVLVWYTHPRESRFSVEEQVEAFNETTGMVCTCSQFRDALISQGVEPQRAQVVLGAADPDLFQPHRRRGRGAIGLSSAFYERKRPDALVELVQMLPHRRFVLLGRGWEAYDRWNELISAPNFQYVTAPYAEYPNHNAGFDVFLSLSTLEGGPIPLIEAMMCNIAPVASRTGFAPDLIRHGENGFLFDVDAPTVEIGPLIEQAFALKANVRRSVRRYSWDAFARQIHSLAETV